MAHLVTGYAGYAHIRSADEGAFNASFFGGGQYVMEFGNCFEGSIIDNNTVRILDGDGLMYGRHFRIEPNAYEDLTIDTGTGGTSRIDLICMTYEKNANDETEKAFLQVIKGTETTGTAYAPEYTDGNILEGAMLNQMPLYKVTIEGVVLSKIEPLFEKLPSYEALAQTYAERFEAICEELKETFLLNNVLKKTDVVDNLESEAKNLPLSANQGRILNEKFTVKVKEITGTTSTAGNVGLGLNANDYLVIGLDVTSTSGATAYSSSKYVSASSNEWTAKVLSVQTHGQIESTEVAVKCFYIEI